MLRRLLVPFAAAAIVSLAACGDDDGGGGGDKVSANDYASKVCTAFGDWANSIRDRQQELQKGLGANASAQEGKDALGTFFSDAVDTSDQLVQDIEDAAVPDVDNGQDAADALHDAASKAKSELEDASNDVDNLPTNSPQEFIKAAAKFSTVVTGALSGIGSELQQVDAPDLNKAFNEEPACQSS